ncbi:hypothetical protein BDZ89DRAFT_1148105 [Hymenopellis radicata]|nr:hypothetical protein BDZ89DRAFT_1148105 [Hymenopellis radicata]
MGLGEDLAFPGQPSPLPRFVTEGEIVGYLKNPEEYLDIPNSAEEANEQRQAAMFYKSWWSFQLRHTASEEVEVDSEVGSASDEHLSRSGASSSHRTTIEVVEDEDAPVTQPQSTGGASSSRRVTIEDVEDEMQHARSRRRQVELPAPVARK